MGSMSRFIVTIILLIAATVAAHAFSGPETSISRRPLAEFPGVIGEWKAVDNQYIDERSMAVLLVDDYIMRTYVNKKGETISLYIGYFKTQREGKQVHSPRQCLPGAGWSIIKHTEYFLTVEDHNPSRVPINLHLMGKSDQRQLYLWWYQGRGRIYANEYFNKLYLIWDAFTKNRTDGALVRVSMNVNPSLEQTMSIQFSFIHDFLPIISEYIPN